MDAFGGALTGVLAARRAQHIEAASRAVAGNPLQHAGKYSEADLGQMVDGFVAVLIERLEGRGRAAWDFYFETVIPGLLAAGEPLPAIVHTVVAWTVFVTDDVAAHIAPTHREATITWLAAFFGAYVADLVRAGERARA